MPARRRHYPGRHAARGISATRGAYDLCRGCPHPRVKHLTGPLPGCAGTVYVPDPGATAGPGMIPGTCPCPGFTETEE
jgi:hypothetical protein